MVNRFMTEFSTILKCEYFPLCSGCQIQGEVSSPPIWREIKTFFKSIVPDLNLSEVTGWRTRSKLAARGTSIEPEIGLFKHGSHQVVSIPSCPLHHPSINILYAKIKKVIIERKIDPYNEENGTGILRYLQFVVERKTARVQLALILNRRDRSMEEVVKQLYVKEGLHSVWLNFQSEQTNRIFGEEWLFCEGEPYLWETLGEAECAFHPACFGQANLALFEKVLKQIREWVAPNSRILELYAGVGVISLNLVSRAKEVVCVEINPYAFECFHLNRLKLNLDLQEKISMQIIPSEQALSLIDGKDVVIVDPPRKGLEPKVLEALCQTNGLSQLVYLSCGPISFQRDCEKLLACGWKLERLEGYLFFPGTNHVELLGFFIKSP